MARSHHPPHLQIDNQWTLLSAATFQRRPLLGGDRDKDLFRDILEQKTLSFDITLRAWVILDQHYHLLLKLGTGAALPRFVAALHGASSMRLNRSQGDSGRRVWDNYWDTGMRNEQDLWTRFNYIHHNPVKHGYVERMEDWPWSSYRFHLEQRGLDWMVELMRRYPVVDTLRGDVF